MNLDADVNLDTFIQAKDDLSGADIRVGNRDELLCSRSVWRQV